MSSILNIIFTMAYLTSFADYPKPVEGPDTGPGSKVDKNPVLRGLPLKVLAAV